MGYTAYVLSHNSRRALQKIFPPKYTRFIGEHITYKFGVNSDHPLPSDKAKIKVIGYAEDKNGLEALVVSINGSSRRPDGKVFHITWSLERKFKPVDSNRVIASKGIQYLENQIDIQCFPMYLK